MPDAQAITLALRGRWYGTYGLAFCPAHDNHRTPALRLSGGEDGRLLALCSAGCSFAQVADALADMGLLDGSDRRAPPDPFAVARAQAEARRTAERRRRQAAELWHEAEPAAGTLAGRYLRARGIAAEPPPTLRFHGSCWHPSARRLPAILALVTREGEPQAVGLSRTWLEEPGRKARVEPAKAMLGPVAGGAVRLSGGAGALVVAEGIETALSLPTNVLGASPRVWAALSTSGMAGLRLPAEPGRLIVAPDDDPPGRAAADALADRACRLGWSVDRLPPPAGRGDWNDILREGAAV